MMFLLRMTLWLTVILALLPSFASSDNAGTTSNAPQISAVEAVSAASATVGDMSKFCSRQPDACAVGAEAATAIGQKAQAGAKIIYKFLNERRAAQSTGSIGASGATGAIVPSRGKLTPDTLTPSDLSPVWRGPQPAKEAQARRPA